MQIKTEIPSWSNGCVRFIMLVGPSGSGKSTFASLYRGNNIVLHSSDAIRLEIYGSEEEQKDPARVFDLMKRRSVTSLKDGYDVIYDATNLNGKKRKSTIGFIKQQLKNSGIKVKYICKVFAVDIPALITNDLRRRRNVGEEVIRRQISQFEVPLESEGWDYICFDPEYSFDISTFMRKNRHMLHDNPHHSLNIDEHMLMATDKLAKLYCNRQEVFPRFVENAVRYHDIGKFLTKTSREDGAHYPNHANVGAYLILAADLWLEPDEFIYAATLINLHMRHYTYHDKTSLDNFHTSLGWLESYLTELEWADREAH